MSACLCVGGTSWIWSSCCCPSWASLWRRLRRLLCPSTPPSSASWECWGSHEVWTPSPPRLSSRSSIHPPWHTLSQTRSHSGLSHKAVLLRCLVKQPRRWDSPLCHFCMAGLSRVIRPDGTEKRSTEKEREKYWERGERWGKIAEGGGEPRHIKSVSELSCERLRLGIEGINERREGRGGIKGRGGGDE